MTTTARAGQPTARPVKPARDWPRPQLVHDHRTLFREPVYPDGQPYQDDDLDDQDNELATVTP
ncbi:hypothetical protein ACPCTG_32155 [Streptomyces pseudogriseolus]|uniref:hypothetical protein n=1 Tax=Streptomyces pseudogriseolus TaxID=36817 RepID=UPI003FA1F3FB